MARPRKLDANGQPVNKSTDELITEFFATHKDGPERQTVTGAASDYSVAKEAYTKAARKVRKLLAAFGAE